ncbi:uncharacterized protein LOC127726809 [Mytilus californianus]|uniref:uncharacterized protein LOC127726809 n=1 Tax=Mytilus californianus TaxID=6549 RepID=UPI0022486EA7|nr:uncharacterized protein LOC127726809 [Mytilus californianus]
MGRIMMIVFELLFLSAVMAFDMKFDYQIIDGEAKYLENIETNLEKNIVKIHTPAHNDIIESFQIQDFRQGQQLTCLPSINQCRLRDIDRELAIDAGQITEAFIHSWNKGDKSITSADGKVVTEMYYADVHDVIQPTFLKGAVKEFYQDFEYPLYKEKKIPQDAEVYNMTRSTGHRAKRGLVSFNNDCRMKVVYGIDSGRRSNHLRICQRPEYRNGATVLIDSHYFTTGLSMHVLFLGYIHQSRER